MYMYIFFGPTTAQEHTQRRTHDERKRAGMHNRQCPLLTLTLACRLWNQVEAAYITYARTQNVCMCISMLQAPTVLLYSTICLERARGGERTVEVRHGVGEGSCWCERLGENRAGEGKQVSGSFTSSDPRAILRKL